MKTTNLMTHSEQIFADGTAHFNALFRDIESATTSIDLETFIFGMDDLGKRLTDALVRAAQRGVRVRVLVDGAGTPWWGTQYAKALEQAGAVTRVFHPFPWQLWNLSRSVVKLPAVLKAIYLLLKINARNHRKVCIIDTKIAYIGSMNISQCHLDQASGGENWRDTSVRLADLDLSELVNAFEHAWSHRTLKERIRTIFQQVRQDPIIRLNNNWHRRRILYKSLLRKIAQSKQRIWITNAYFVPDNILLRRLKEAAQRGVDVRIVLPRKSDVMMMPWASATFYFSLLKAGVRIFEYQPSMLHAKSLLIDHWALIGSSNLNHRSLLHDLEADINLTQDHTKKKLAQLFLTDLKHSNEVSLTDWWRIRPWRQRLLGQCVLYIKYLI